MRYESGWCLGGFFAFFFFSLMDRLKSPKRNEVSGMEVHLSQPPAPFAEAGNGFNRR